MAKAAKADKRGKAKPKPKQKPARNLSLTALAATVFLFVAGAAGLVYWLSSSYDPVVDISLPAAELRLAAPPERPAANGREAPAVAAESHSNGSATDSGHAAAPAPTDGHADATAPEQHAASASPERGGETAATADQDGNGPSRGEVAPADSTATMPGHTEDTHAGSGQAAGHAGTDQASAGHGTAAHGSDAAPPPAPGADQVAALAPAPQPGLVTPSPSGPLPVVAPDGRTPLAAYARPYVGSGRPRIVIVLGNLGMSQSTTIAAIQQLPGAVTLAFHPYGRDLQDYVDQARAAGHEVLLEVPMEPLDLANNDPGPFALLTSLPANRNLERLDWVLGRFTGYVGVLSFMGSRFTTSEAQLRPVLEAMQQRGLMFLDSQASSRSVSGRLAEEIGLPRASNDRQIDSLASRNAIDAQLKELEQIARTRGQAIGIGFPYPVTIERLSQWARSLDGKGIDLVPASAVVLQRSPT